MKLLRITTSEDTEARIPEEQRVPYLAARQFEAETGEPMEIVHRIFWPTPALPDLVSGWLDKHQPDMVFVVVSAYCFCYESVPLRLEHRLGRVGRFINAQSQRLANTHAISERKLFALGRNAAFNIIGADANFTVRETIERTDEVVRRVLAHEGVVLAVRGPRRPLAPDGGERAVARAERKRQQVNRGIQRICERQHVDCHIFEKPPFDLKDETKVFGDIIHTNATQQAIEAKLQAEFLVSAWRRAHA